MVDAMNMMGYDALALGRMDFAIGTEALTERLQEAEFAMLSANVLDLETRELLVEPYTILNREGVSIGIIGLSDAEVIQAPGLRDRAIWLDPLSTIGDLVAQVSEQVDVLIVLSHMGLERDQLLARTVPGINVIVGGYTRKLMQEPEREGNTLIVQQGYQGEWVGKLTVTIDEQGVPTDYTEEILTLDDSYTDDKEMTELVDRYKEMYPTPTPMPTHTPTPSR